MLGRKWGIMIMTRDESEDVGRDLIIIKRSWSHVGKFENCSEGNGEPWKGVQQGSSVFRIL